MSEKKQSIPVFVVDAFASNPFEGNPAAICPLAEWLPDGLMQQIAMENNLSETAFTVPYEDAWQIRWFTPTVEVDLCGHATLAAAHVFYTMLGHTDPAIRFFSKSGWLTVYRSAEGLTLDFPADHATPVEMDEQIIRGLGIRPVSLWKGTYDYMAVLENEQQVRELRPDFSILASIKARGILVTARGEQIDFVSRCFFPPAGVNEDPVTGSAHCLLTPFWGHHLNRTRMDAVQLSDRKGYLRCEWKGDRVWMTGSARIYLKGEIFI